MKGLGFREVGRWRWPRDSDWVKERVAKGFYGGLIG